MSVDGRSVQSEVAGPTADGYFDRVAEWFNDSSSVKLLEFSDGLNKSVKPAFVETLQVQFRR
jgi:hypothetical protein